MDSYDALQLCEAYARLGNAVQDQMKSLFELGSPDDGDFNMNALAYVHEFCGKAAELCDDDEYGDFASMAGELERYAVESGGKFEYGRWIPGESATVGRLGI